MGRIHRSEIYYVDLSGTKGREINNKKRPAVVLTVNDINSKNLTVVVIPGTKQVPKYPGKLNIVSIAPTDLNGLSAITYFQCHQLRALSHERFDDLPVGILSDDDLSKLEIGVRYTLGIQDSIGQISTRL